MPRLKKIKYKDIPLEFRLQHRREAEDFCDSQTSLLCYCGRLASGLHTSSCRKYRQHFERFIENKFNAQQSSTQIDTTNQHSKE